MTDQQANNNLSINIDDNDKDNSASNTPNKTMLTPQNATSLKAQLFELFKAADKDQNQLIDRNEFASVINKFVPNTNMTKMKEMFDTLDANSDDNISYVEFLNDENFNKFLQYCGFFQYPDTNDNNKSDNNNSDDKKSDDDDVSDDDQKDKNNSDDIDYTNADDDDDNDDVIDDNKDANKIAQTLTPQEAKTIKTQLFELCVAADIDKNDKIDFNEFSTVINRFLPHTSQTKMKEMFSALDANGDGNISYQEFLEDSNFTLFLDKCGYVINTLYKEKSRKDSITDIIRQSGLNRAFSVRNDHDRMFIASQKEIIDKLHAWITSTGRPAIDRVSALELEIDGLKQSVSNSEMIIESINSELRILKTEKLSLQSQHDVLVSHKKILQEQVADIRDELATADNNLEEYYEKDKKFNKLQNKLNDLNNENNKLRNEYDNVLKTNKIFEDKNKKLSSQLDDKNNIILTTKEELNQKINALNGLNTIIENQKLDIDDAKEKIIDLEQQYKLVTQSNTMTYQPPPSSSNSAKTIRINNNNGMNAMLQQSEPTDYGGFYQDDTVRTTVAGGTGTLVQFGTTTVYNYSDNEMSPSAQNQNDKYILLEKEFNKLEKQLKEERLSHELEIKNINDQHKQMLVMLQEQYKKRSPILLGKNPDDDQNNDNDAILHSDPLSASADENAPLMNDQNEKRVRKTKQPPPTPTCVCFSFSLW